MLRALMKRDLDQLKKIHKQFYENEFPLDNLSNMACAFCVTNDNDEVITAGGIKPIMEAIIITDKSSEIHERRLALLMMLNQAMTLTSSAGYDQLHAFIQDEKWARHLLKYGFHPTKGVSLVTKV